MCIIFLIKFLASSDILLHSIVSNCTVELFSYYFIKSSFELALNGRLPLNNIYSKTPKDHTSLFKLLNSFFKRTSGATKYGIPIWSTVSNDINSAKKKFRILYSKILLLFYWYVKFSEQMLLCTIFKLWRLSMVKRIFWKISIK